MDKLTITKDWYKNYYSKYGYDRNNLLTNRGVLFQAIALKNSFIKSLSKINLDPSSYILDVGCGSGIDLIELVKYRFDQKKLFGVDIDDARIEIGKYNYPLLNLSNQDAAKLNFQDNYFNLVFESTMFNTITETKTSEKIANEMLRVTKKNGYIFLIDWRYGKLWNQNYIACNKKRVKKLFNVGSDTEIISIIKGSLIPPIGRYLSTYFGWLYFVIHKLFPFLVGQVTYILKKK